MDCLLQKFKKPLSIFTTLFIMTLGTVGAQDACASGQDTCCEIPCQEACVNWIDNPWQFYFGPEVYHAHRNKKGGSTQDGWLYGARGGFDYIKRYCFYIGSEVAWARGALRGKYGEDGRLKSHLTDAMVEGRFGYTFQRKHGRKAAITPYFSGGYFSERNNYVHPSPLTIHFHTYFPYVGTGFLSRIDLTPNLEFGINAKFKFPLDPQSQVSHDPEVDDHKLGIEERFQYRIELPLKYQFCRCNEIYIFSLSPFYEYRLYGQQLGYPYDFLETTFNIYGITAEIFYQF